MEEVIEKIGFQLSNLINWVLAAIGAVVINLKILTSRRDVYLERHLILLFWIGTFFVITLFILGLYLIFSHNINNIMVLIVCIPLFLFIITWFAYKHYPIKQGEKEVSPKDPEEALQTN
ncbi:hypothetical protein ISS37_07185 [candidate division KSB1 bacterium]|nr:hypothetical protein [candidate division KSB1 bacterium]